MFCTFLLASLYIFTTSFAAIPPYGNDRQLALEKLERNGLALEFLPEYQGDVYLVDAAVFQNPDAIQFASPLVKEQHKLRDEEQRATFKKYAEQRELKEKALKRESRLLAFEKGAMSFEDLKEEEKNDPEFLLTAVKIGQFHSDALPDKYKSDVNLAKPFVHQNFKFLEKCEMSIKNDKNVVLEACRMSQLKKMQGGNGSFKAFKYASLDLRNDEDTVTEAIRIDFRTFQFASDKLKSNLDVMVRLYQVEPRVLKFCHNSKVLLYFIQKVGYQVFELGSRDLRNNENIVTEAIRIDYRTFQFAPKKFKSSIDVMMRLYQVEPRILNFYDNPKYILHLITKNGYKAFEYASRDLKEDEDTVTKAMRIDFRTFQFASEKLKWNIDVMMRLYQVERRILKFCHNSKVLLYFVQKEGYQEFAIGNLGLRNDENTVTKAIRIDYRTFQFASKKLKLNTDVVMRLYQVEPRILQFVHNAIVFAPEFFLHIIAKEGLIDIFKSSEVIWIKLFKDQNFSSSDQRKAEIVLYLMNQIKYDRSFLPTTLSTEMWRLVMFANFMIDLLKPVPTDPRVTEKVVAKEMPLNKKRNSITQDSSVQRAEEDSEAVSKKRNVEHLTGQIMDSFEMKSLIRRATEDAVEKTTQKYKNLQRAEEDSETVSKKRKVEHLTGQIMDSFEMKSLIRRATEDAVEKTTQKYQKKKLMDSFEMKSLL